MAKIKDTISQIILWTFSQIILFMFVIPVCLVVLLCLIGPPMLFGPAIESLESGARGNWVIGGSHDIRTGMATLFVVAILAIIELFGIYAIAVTTFSCGASFTRYRSLGRLLQNGSLLLAYAAKICVFCLFYTYSSIPIALIPPLSPLPANHQGIFGPYVYSVLYVLAHITVLVWGTVSVTSAASGRKNR